MNAHSNFSVLFGSETGTAQDVAENLWKTAKRNDVKCSVSSLDEYNVEKLPWENCVVFVVSTTGQGDVPTKMQQFWKFLLRKDLPSNSLGCLRFAVLGLGDSSYKKFNFAARKLQKRLLQLGATELLKIGLADDQDEMGIDTVVEPFVRALFQKLSETLGFEPKILSEADEIIEKYAVRVLDNMIDEVAKKDIHRNTDSLAIAGKVVGNTRTTATDHFQDARLIKLAAKDLDYAPGDILYIKPKNSAEKVGQFFRILKDCGAGVEGSTVIRVEEKEIKLPNVLKQELSLHDLAEQYWDLNCIPTRTIIKNLSMISDHELEKPKLAEFSGPGGLEDLYSYVNRPRRTVLEVLGDFPNTTRRLNEKLLFEVMSPIKPRAFSICSSSKYSKNEVHILVAVVKYKTKLVEPRLGLCSNWLAALGLDSDVSFRIQKGSFKFHHEKPMILIGPGTGVAPFRSLLLEKAAGSENLENCALFFGCRNETKDYHCREEFEMLKDKFGLKLFCAFSRDQKDKEYVQHVIKREERLCWDFLRKGGSIYLAGNAKNMPKSVKDELSSVVESCGEMSREEAEKFVNNLENSGRYQTETW